MDSPHPWRLLHPFDFQELLFFSAISSSSFHFVLGARVTLQRLHSFGFVCTILYRLFISPNSIRTPRPARENSGQREGKDVPLHLFSCQSRGNILGPRWDPPFVPA